MAELWPRVGFKVLHLYFQVPFQTIIFVWHWLRSKKQAICKLCSLIGWAKAPCRRCAFQLPRVIMWGLSLYCCICHRCCTAKQRLMTHGSSSYYTDNHNLRRYVCTTSTCNGPRRRPARLLLVRRAFSSWVALQSSSFFLENQFLHLVCAGRAMKKFALQRWKTDLSQVSQIYLGEKHCLGCLVAPWWQAAPRNAVALSSTL